MQRLEGQWNSMDGPETDTNACGPRTSDKGMRTVQGEVVFPTWGAGTLLGHVQKRRRGACFASHPSSRLSAVRETKRQR